MSINWEQVAFNLTKEMVEALIEAAQENEWVDEYCQICKAPGFVLNPRHSTYCPYRKIQDLLIPS